MTNEELAVRIQQGERDKLLELWGQVRRFAYKQAKRWAAWGKLEIEDYLQEAFIALIDAVEKWKPGDASFLTWYYLRVKGHFSAAAGLRTKRDRLDPLQYAESLDALRISETGGDPYTLGDVIPDPAAEAAFLTVEDLERYRAVEAAIASLSERQQAAIRAGYYEQACVLSAAAQRKEEASALRALRNPKISRELKAYQ